MPKAIPLKKIQTTNTKPIETSTPTNLIYITIDSIDGDNAKGRPYEPGRPAYPYKTLDFAYDQQRTLFPSADIVAEILKGTVNMDLLNYHNLTVNKGTQSSPFDELCYLNINCKSDESINLTDLYLNIDTTINVPHSSVNLPALITKHLFYFNQANVLSMVEQIISGTKKTQKMEPSIPRIVIENHGIFINDSDGGIIDFPTMHIICIKNVGESAFSSNVPNTMDLTIDSHYLYSEKYTLGTTITAPYVGGITNITLHEAVGTIQESMTTVSEPPINACKVSTWNALLWGAVISFTILTVGTYPLYLAIGCAIRKKNKSSLKSNQNSSLPNGLIILESNNDVMNNDEIVKKLVSHLDNSKNRNVKKHLTKLINNVTSNKNGMSTFNNITLKNNTPDKLKKLCLTNFAANINANLIDAELFTDPSLATKSNYNITENTRSYNNNGSIFRHSRVITSNYTQTLQDGNVFLVDASLSNLVITVPTSVLEDRLFEYKRIDNTNHIVTVTTPNGIDNLPSININNKCYDKKTGKYLRLGRVALYGYKEKLWILNK